MRKSVLLKPQGRKNDVTVNSNIALLQHSKVNLTPPEQKLNVIKPTAQPKYLTKSIDYLQTDNNLSEFDTKAEQLAVKLNLGIEGNAVWGNIDGYIEDQQDLINYIDDTLNDELVPIVQNLEKETEQLQDQLNEQADSITAVQTDVNENLHKKVTIENEDETEASKQIQYIIKNSDLNLNSDFTNALTQVLGGREINSVDDAISVLLHKMFPIVYTDWDIQVTNAATVSYSIEKGTKKSITLSAELGTINISLRPGNKGDTLVSLTVNGTDILEQDKNEYSIKVKFSDLTSESNINSTKEKSYEIIATTTSKTIQKTVKASINITNVQYYFFDSDVTQVTSIGSTAVKQTSNEYLYNLGDSEEFITIFSPKQPKSVEAKGGEDPNSLDTSWRTLQDYTTQTVSYTPTNGTVQTYYRITLKEPQSRCLKIKIVV